MRTLSLLTFLVILVSAAVCSDDKDKAKDLQALKTDAEQAVARAQAADSKDCTKECLEAARRLIELSDQYFTMGNVKDGHTAMDDAGRFAVKAGRAAVDTKKRRKDTEIGLRKLQKRVSDIEETLNFDDRASVHEIVTSISKARSDILMSLFDMPKKELGPGNKEKP